LFQTFGGLIPYIQLGKGVGQIMVTGDIYMNCQNQLPGIKTYYQKFGQMRNSKVMISLLGVTFSGIIANSTGDLAEENDTIFRFALTFQIFDDSIGKSS
jgi:hypothetical protein